MPIFRYAKSLSLNAELLNSSFGHVTAKISGKGAGKAFQYETGLHSLQRVPPTEKKGRRQTSVISVAVLPLPPERSQKPIPEDEVEITTMIGTGPGGQHRQKTESCVRAKHKPTGTTVVIDMRSQHQSRQMAIRVLTARVNEILAQKEKKAYSESRKQQLGDGNRGGKVRTYNFIESRVTDHRTGKKANIKAIMKGEFNLLF